MSEKWVGKTVLEYHTVPLVWVEDAERTARVILQLQANTTARYVNVPCDRNGVADPKALSAALRVLADDIDAGRLA